MTAAVRTQSMPAHQFPRIPFTNVLRAEWHKTTGARAARWLLAAAALTTIAAPAIPLLFPHNVKQSSTSYLTWAGVGLTRLLPVVLILAMTAEWSQRTAMSTFTLEPRRGRVLTAKIVTGLGVSLLGACFALAVSQLVVAAAHAAGRDVASGGSWPQFAGSVVFILLTGATGIATSTALWIVLPLTLGLVRTLRREVR
jgi:ABC-2 type transport system permease protein